MKTVACTYCAGPKAQDEGLLPAYRRYHSERIQALQAAATEQIPLLILSGRYGLIDADTPIPWYDHLLESRELESFAAKVLKQMTALKLSAVVYHTADASRYPQVLPYLQAMQDVCGRAGVDLQIVTLPGNPD
jgi:hypothetical protein